MPTIAEIIAKGTPGMSGADLEELLQGMFGGGQPRQPRAQQMQMRVSLEDLYTGVTKEVEIPWPVVSQGMMRRERITRSIKVEPGMADGTKLLLRSGSPQKPDVILILAQLPHRRPPPARAH